MGEVSKAFDYVKKGDLIELEQLLATTPEIIEERDNSGRSLLHVACLFSKETLVECLVKAGADVHSKDKRSLTPLDRCFQYKPGKVNIPKSIRVVQILRQAGAKIEGYKLYDLLRISLGCQSLADCIFTGKYITAFNLSAKENALIERMRECEEYDLIMEDDSHLTDALFYHFIETYNWDNGYDLIDWITLQEQCSLIIMVKILDALCVDDEHFTKKLNAVASFNRDAYRLAQAFAKERPELLELYEEA